MAKDLPIKKTIVSDIVLKSMICELLDKGERGATNFYELLRTKIKLSKDRCLKMYPAVELEWSNFKENIINEQRVVEVSEAAKDGLLSDLELEKILCQYASNNVTVEEFIRGEAILRAISPMESISAIAAIFKKRGSNAPIKSALTNAEGKDLPQPTANLDNKKLDLLLQLTKRVNDTTANNS